MNPKVFILLLNWNNWDQTKECLESLEFLNYSNFAVLLIDNGSDDNSLEKMREFQNQNPQMEIVILENGKNLGFGGGNNTGIDYALKHKADYVLLLNNDTFVAQDFLGRLVEVAQSNPKAGLLTPSIFFYDKRDLLWFGGKVSFNWWKMDKAVKMSLFKKPVSKNAKQIKIQFASGACMLIGREVLEKVGGFYPPYFLYFEDADLSFLILRAGYDLLWVPSSNIWHKVSATTLPKLGSASLHYYNTRNILLLAKRYGPFWVRYFYMHIWAIYKYIKQLLKILIGRNKKVSLAIKQGIEDYYRKRFGKYQNFR
ncbi:MAG: hypothetical protein A3H51_00195 [Candidatus Spechtbacteria bacterium RIFCSPLOWO2_02_FULL_38_8]|uniref:Glycosyltransferase 2-like domain-containing protein n=1 Tax=Candidatus Spechtbacteria bacterium RIFCSPLOWO2_02_FULL_38_8 TaxID=1802164 RepID=A0A1G2HIU2_9BACT|nr:MAG: hypothetical protein A3H51_00195 [Candidatus Spechtbacteria bacterium RIFCSPLOWO2_02_FULL_38_8]